MFRQSKNKKLDDEIQNIELEKSLKSNRDIFKDIFDKDDTIKFREFETHIPNSINCCVIFEDGMVNTEIINENILWPMMNNTIDIDNADSQILDFIIKKVLISDEIEKSTDIDKLIGSVLYGDTILLVDGIDEAIILNTKGWKVRSISEPISERNVKGPREGFIESVLINTSLLRRKIKDPNLKFKFSEIGTITKTSLCICYIEGLANEQILKELEKRIDQIDIDGVLATNYIQELITDSPFSPFQTIGYTERPDVAASKLLEGRFIVIVDGTPVVSTLPFIFMEYFQSSEDYYDNYIFSSINRILRYIALFLTTSVPAIYVALVTFHQEMIPTQLLLSIASAREGVPFPTIVEALALMLSFELMREGAIRLPESVGATVGIVGALVMGDAAVQARLVSAPMVIVVALTGISASLIYSMKGAIIVNRIIFIVLAGFLGLYGYIFGVIGLFIHLMSLKSFGVPYMSNLGSINKQDLKDTAIRVSWAHMYLRPKMIGKKNPTRQNNSNKKGS